MKLILVLAVVAVISVQGININKLPSLIQGSNSNKAPGEDKPDDLNQCGGNFQAISNCLTADYATCGNDVGIFDQSWLMPGSADHVSSYLNCVWEGEHYTGSCVPKEPTDNANYCWIYPPPQPSTSPVASPTSAASSSKAPSSTKTAARSPSMSDPWAICYNSAVNGYNLKPVKIGDVPSFSGPVGSTYSIDLSQYFCDPERMSLTYTVEGNIPQGLSVTGSTFGGTLTTPGHYQISAYAEDESMNPGVSITWWIDVTA